MDRALELDEIPQPALQQEPVHPEVLQPAVKNVISVDRKNGKLVATNALTGHIMQSPGELQQFLADTFMPAHIQQITAIQKSTDLFCLQINYVDVSCDPNDLKAVPSQLKINIPAGEKDLFDVVMSYFEAPQSPGKAVLKTAQKKNLTYFRTVYEQDFKVRQKNIQDITPPPTPLERIKDAGQKLRAGFENILTLKKDPAAGPALIPVVPKVMHITKVVPEPDPKLKKVEGTTETKKENPLQSEATVGAPVEEFEEGLHAFNEALAEGKRVDLKSFSGLSKALLLQVAQIAKTFFVHKKTDEATLSTARRTILAKVLPWVKGPREAMKENTVLKAILRNVTRIFKRSAQKGQETVTHDWKQARSARENFFQEIDNMFAPQPMQNTAPNEEIKPETVPVQDTVVTEKVTAADIMSAPPSWLERASNKAEKTLSHVGGQIRGKLNWLLMPQQPQRPHSRDYKAQRA